MSGTPHGAPPSDCKSAALWYAEQLSFYIVPVWWNDEVGTCACGNPECPENSWGKHPIGILVPRGLLDATRDPETIDRFWRAKPLARVGIAVRPSGLCVLDSDPRNGGHISLEQVGRLPETPLVQTGRGDGGEHRYFRRPDGLAPQNVKLLPGLELIGNGMVVAPPSGHRCGGVYQWELSSGPHRIEFAELPECILALLKRDGGAKAKPDGDERVWPKGERDDQLFRHLCRLRAAGAGEAELIAVAEIRGREWCKPPLSERQLHEKVKSALRYKSEKDHDPTAETAALEDLTRAIEKAIIPGPVLEHMEFPRRKIVIGAPETFEVREGGLVVVSSIAGLGKSTFLSQLARGFALGEPVLGIPCAKTPTLFITAEEIAEEMSDRFLRIFPDIGLPPNLHVLPVDAIDGLQEVLSPLVDPKAGPPSFVIDGPLGAKVLVALGTRCLKLGIGVVMFDPLAFLITGDDADNTFLRSFLRDFTRWGRKHGLVSFIAHHDRKPGSSGPGRSMGTKTDAQARVRGGTALPGAVHLLLSLQEGKLPDAVRIVFAKVRRGRVPETIPVRMDRATGLLVPDHRLEDATQVKDGNLERIFEFLCEKGPHTAEAIHEALKLKNADGAEVTMRTTKSYLTALATAGRIVGEAPKKGSGKGRGKASAKVWRVADEGPAESSESAHDAGPSLQSTAGDDVCVQGEEGVSEPCTQT